jgi:hypothetical protein
MDIFSDVFEDIDFSKQSLIQPQNDSDNGQHGGNTNSTSDITGGGMGLGHNLGLDENQFHNGHDSQSRPKPNMEFNQERLDEVIDMMFTDPVGVVTNPETESVVTYFERHGSKSDHMKFYDQWICSNVDVLLPDISIFRITRKQIRLLNIL